MLIGGGATEIVIVVETFLSAGVESSVSVRPTEKFPLTVGVPEITPVEEDKATPAGSWPEVTVHV